MKHIYIALLLITSLGFAQPSIQQPSNFVQCDTNFDSSMSFNLTTKNVEILNGLNPADYTVSYHVSQALADTGTSPLPANYTNPTNPKTLFVRVWENSNPSNFATTTLILQVLYPPFSYFLQQLVEADAPFDGIATFDLTAQAAPASNYQSGFSMAYYTTNTDMLSGTNPLSPAESAAFTNTVNPQTIYMTVTNDNTGCVAYRNFSIIVIPNDIVTIPDPVLKAHLLSATAQGTIANDLNNHQTAIDLSNDGEIQVYEALNITKLYILGISASSAVGLEAFTNLTQLVFAYTNLTSFDPTPFVNLTSLQLNENQLTTFSIQDLPLLTSLNIYVNNLNSLTVSNLPVLTYLDFNSNDLSSASLVNLPSITTLRGYNNQLSSLDLSGFPQITQLVLNNNLFTELDFSGLSELTFLNFDDNQLTEFDPSPLTNLYVVSCADNQLTEIDFSNNPDFAAVDCANNNLTYLNLKNGKMHQVQDMYQVFAGNPNLTFICIDEDELSVVQGLIAGSSLSGVNLSPYCSFTPGGDYNTITGTVRFDSENDGCTVSDPTFPNIKLKLTQGATHSYTFTSASGEYSFYTGAGNYSLTPEFENPAYFGLIIPINVNFPGVNNAVSTQNFCVVPNGVHPDVEVVFAKIMNAVPGFMAQYLISYKNKGNQTASGTVALAYEDAVLDFTMATVAPDLQSVGLLSWNYADLLPFESRSFYLEFDVNAPTDTPPVNIDDILDYTATISLNALADDTPDDNVFQLHQVVVGSYDPNDKICLQGNVVSPSQIGEYLHYIINFENTGTAPAQNVVVRDVIDVAQFDVNSLQILSSSHPVVARINGNTVDFVFENIQLDSGGHGNILMKVKTLSTLTEGTTVSNKADIYFDYNAPVVTEFANTQFQSLAVNDHNISTITLYPNPTTDLINISAKSTITSILLFDVQGRVLQTMLPNDIEAVLDVSQKASGVYFIKIITDDGTLTQKILKN